MTGDAGADSAPTVFLHIGCPKSGTSHIQARLARNAAVARAQGVFWPGPWGRQIQAVRDARSLERGGELAADGAWRRLSADILADKAGAAVISMEWLVGLRPAQVTACVSALAPARVEVICTARDLLRGFPAHWQESTQNYRTWTWDEYDDAVVGRSGRHPARGEFWRQHDVPKILRRWSHAVPWDQIHLVTVPPAGDDPDQLWQRFCSVVGMQAEAFARPERSNPSLGARSARLLQQVNVAARDRGVPKTVYQRHYKHLLSKRILARHRNDESPIAVSTSTETWLRGRAAELVRETDELPINVVGDLQDLIPGPPVQGTVPSTLSDADLLSAAIETIIDLLEAGSSDSSG